MNRSFSVNRRAPNLIDLYTPVVPGVFGYRLKNAANFDAVFATFLTSSNVGYLDHNVDRGKVESQPTAGRQVRIVFDPASYGMDDTKYLWLEMWHVDSLGVETQVSAPTLVLPFSANNGVGIVTIHGTAPVAASSAGSLQIDFPRLMEDFRIHNEEVATNLFVATSESGAEQQLKPDTFPQYQIIRATQGSIWVRGGGAAAAFSAICTVSFPR